jgi:protein ImuB
MNASSSTRRYLSMWLRWLSTDRIARACTLGAHAPGAYAPDDALVVAAPIKSALRLTAVNAVASALGLKPGMALADARAMHPRLKAVDADPLADRQFLEAVADWCDRYTPLVGLHPPDGLILDISGCAHLFGGEARLCGDLVCRLRLCGVQARAAVADTVGCAWAMAHYGVSADSAARSEHAAHQRAPLPPPLAGEGGRIRGDDEWLIIPPGVTREVLATLPVGALRLAPDTVTLLGEVGLKRVADLLDRPRAALTARFGAELIWRLDQALGRDDESITPRRPLPCYVAEQRFADPIALERDVLGTIGRLGQRVERTLTQHGEGARLLEIALYRVDGKVLRFSAATSRAIRAAALMRRLFAERLTALGDEHDPGFGFDMIRLSVVVAERLDDVQTGFGAPDHREELAQLVDRLGARLGFRCVLRIASHDTHIPEFAAVEVRADDGRTEDDSSVERPAPLMLRPIKLFARPEPIEAVAEVPDGPPVRFRWRHVLHEVAAAEGPERLAMEWWRDDAGRTLTRDYFRIESREGARFWLYREGLYAREVAQPRWFLHGLFA